MKSFVTQTFGTRRGEVEASGGCNEHVSESTRVTRWPRATVCVLKLPSRTPKTVWNVARKINPWQTG